MKKSVDFDKFTDSYNQLLSESTNFFAPNENYFARYKIDIVKRHYRYTARQVLEYGCGIGRNISFLKSAFSGAVIHGSDISEVSLDVARKLNPDIYFFNENNFDKQDFEYDLIFVAGVFHHIPPEDRDLAISGLRRRMRKGGEMFIFEHNPFNPVTRRIVDRCPYDDDAILLRPMELKSRLCNSGLEVIDQSYCLFIPPKLKLMLSLENYLRWFPLGGQYWIHARRTV